MTSCVRREDALHPVCEFHRIERLCEITCGARGDAFCLVGVGALRRQKYHGDVSGRGSGLEALAHFDPVDAGEQPVQQYQIRPALQDRRIDVGRAVTRDDGPSSDEPQG
jgi:hypothetical protein